MRVQGTYERLKPVASSLECPACVGRSVEWRAAFKPPRFEVNRVFQCFCSASHPIEFSSENSFGAGFSKAPMSHWKPAGFPSPLGPDRLGRPGEEGGF